MDILIGFLIGFNTVWAVVLIYRAHKERKMRNEIRNNINELYEQFKQFTLMRIEQQDSMLYAYNMTTDEFICQGRNFDEIHDAFTKRFPGEKAIVTQGEELLFKEKMNVAK